LNACAADQTRVIVHPFPDLGNQNRAAEFL
jgi:hypothetical protein